MSKITTAWGTAKLIEEVTLPQRAGQKRFASGRFAYTTDGTARRGPVTLRSADLKRLRDRLDDHPSLAAALGFVGGGELA